MRTSRRTPMARLILGSVGFCGEEEGALRSEEDALRSEEDRELDGRPIRGTDTVASQDLPRGRGRDQAPVEALRALDLTVHPGEVFGLLGPNGAGKTTLVRILATLLRSTDGHAWVGGYDVVQDEQEVRRIIGYAGQDSERSAYFRLSVRENLLYFAHALRGVPIRTARERIDAFAAAVGFTDQLGQHFTALSGGQKQLVIVLRALLHEPEVVFLDEPSKSLDPVTADGCAAFCSILHGSTR